MEQPGGSSSTVDNPIMSPSDYENHFHDLFIGFIREVNLPLDTVHSPLLQQMIHHLNPNVTLPTIEHILWKISGEEQIKNDRTELVPTNLNKTTDGIVPLGLDEMPPPLDLRKGRNGIGKSFCIVCLKWQENSKIRKLKTAEVNIFLFVCVAEKVHSLETAQKLHSSSNQKTCVNHFGPIHEAVLKHLQIKENNGVVSISDEVVANVFLIVKEIKNAPCDDSSLHAQAKVVGSFRHSLQCFLKKFTFRNAFVSANIQPMKSPVPKPKTHPSVYYASTYRPYDEENFPEDFLEP